MKSLNLVSLLSILRLLSTLAYLMKLPDVEEMPSNKGHDPFSLLSPQLSFKQKNINET